MAEDKRVMGAVQAPTDPVQAAAKDAVPEQSAPPVVAVPAGIVLEVPPNMTAISVAGQEFPVVDGKVRVPPALSGTARAVLSGAWRALTVAAERAKAEAARRAEEESIPEWGKRLRKEVTGR